MPNDSAQSNVTPAPANNQTPPVTPQPAAPPFTPPFPQTQAQPMPEFPTMTAPSPTDDISTSSANQPPMQNNSAQTPPPLSMPPVLTPPAPKRSRAKIVGALLALAILAVGVPVGVILVQKNQDIRNRAQESQCNENQCVQPGDGSCQTPETYPTCEGCPSGYSHQVTRSINEDGSCGYSPGTGENCHTDAACGWECGSHGQGDTWCDNSIRYHCASGGKLEDIGPCNANPTAAPIIPEQPSQPAQPSQTSQPGTGTYDRCAGLSATGRGIGACCDNGSQCGSGFCKEGSCAEQPPSNNGGQSGSSGSNATTAAGGDQGSSNQSGSYTAQCLNVKAYDASWNQLSATQLSQLAVGDTVRFAVNGTTSSGTITKARFRINGSPVTWSETISKNPSNEFYYLYPIPAGTTTVNVEAQLYHSNAGWF